MRLSQSRAICVLLLAGLVMGGCAATGGPGAAGAGKTPEWRLAVMAYTFNRVTFFEAVDKTKGLGAKYIEGFSWHRIRPDVPNVQLNNSAPAEALDEVRQKLNDSGVKLVAYYSGDLGKNEADTRKTFDFARKMGIESIVCEPPPESMDLLDRLTVEYGVNVAIHNHPRDPKHPDYRNWDPDEVVRLVKGRNPRIGMCADTGHWLRSDLDPVACLRKYEGRLLTLHLKDTDKKGPTAHDVIWGTGVGDVKAVMAELLRQKWSGLISIEYEHNMENNVADVAACMKYFGEVEKALKN